MQTNPRHREEMPQNTKRQIVSSLVPIKTITKPEGHKVSKQGPCLFIKFVSFVSNIRMTIGNKLLKL